MWLCRVLVVRKMKPKLNFKNVRVVDGGCDHYKHGVEPVKPEGLYRCKRCKAVWLNYWVLHDDIMAAR